MLAYKQFSTSNQSLDGGDLGLGHGLKPGGLPKIQSNPDFCNFQCDVCLKCGELCGCGEGGREEEVEKNDVRKCSINSCNTSESCSDVSNNFKSRRKLFQHLSLPGLTRHEQQREIIEKDIYKKENKKATMQYLLQNNHKLRKELSEADLEIEQLKQDLHICRQQLESKYKSIKLIQKEASVAKNHQVETIKNSKDYTKHLEQEINRIQFEFERSKSTFVSSQEQWSDRFNNISKENSILLKELSTKCDQMSLLATENIDLQRKQDALLMLLNNQDKLGFKAITNDLMNDKKTSCSYTTDELVIIGACKCHKDCGEICDCAKACVTLIRKLRTVEKELKDVSISSDAYRQAFEEHLNRNTKLMAELAKPLPKTLPKHHSPSSSSLKARKSVIKFIELIDKNHNLQLSKIKDVGLDDLSDHELFLCLVDMVSDRNELIAHQRLVIKVLANRVHEYENIVTDENTNSDKSLEMKNVV